MKRVAMACMAAAGLVLAGSGFANEKLAQASGCNTCHNLEKKLIGPSYKDIAAKYRNDKGAEAALVKKVKAGGKGVWGEIPMPPNAHLKDEDIKTMVVWILATK